jgi:beta-lactamase class A
MDIQDEISRITRSHPGVTWSVRIVDSDGEPVVDVAADKQLATASVGKLLLLIETARQLTCGELDPDEWLTRRDGESVGDSGLWQHLRVDRLPIHDVAVLVAGVSDNDATNVLLDRVGLPAVDRLTSDLGLVRTRLLDRVRRERTERHPPHLSVGCASELAAVMSLISRRELVDSAVSEQVHAWLGLNTDLSMVAAPFHCDPLAHVEPDHGLLLRNKTGTNAGVRADTGYVCGYAYAVLTNWDTPGEAAIHRVMSSMGRIGEQLALLAGVDLA